MEDAEFKQFLKNEQYAHLFLDLAMKKIAFQLADQRRLKQTPQFEVEYIRSQSRLSEELEKLDLSDEAHFHLRTYGPEAYVVLTADPSFGRK